MRYDYLLFDADNTLFDFDRAEERALRATLEFFGYPLDSDTRELYRTINRVLWRRLDLGEISREALVVERFALFDRAMGGGRDAAALNRFYLDRLSEGAELLPGAEALCRSLAPRATLALVTNGVARAQRGRLARSALNGLFPYVFISEEVGWQKPQREFFSHVCSAMAIRDRRRAVVIGDNLVSDVQGGLQSGLDAVWFNPNGLPNPTQVRPTWEARSFSALEDYLCGGAGASK
ncbi:MAG TPA: YjjG family noncanonical pyrimidine nucleotidase [Candidatus Flavonifractor intestinipullorum]|uniref:YjjG family noncanonical pyrimidine nucleotidase n=1 Tax=Candidatus Flavonifractor intestinipullorum TaxID=2838587 RepID=A0A9D2S5K0_9FIRM|nr:YjjG family noncanonical pyrimidine nucleotidase [Candidatus Flavonifractor intestinipullorum]